MFNFTFKPGSNELVSVLESGDVTYTVSTMTTLDTVATIGNVYASDNMDLPVRASCSTYQKGGLTRYTSDIARF